MCTVTIIQMPGDGLRLVTNRDESRLRPPATPPQMRVVEGGRALYPRDAKAGGTWVAANDRGIVMTVLNFNDRPAREIAPGRLSRGHIITQTIGASDLQGVMVATSGLPLEDFAPFRLIAAHGDTVAEGRWNRHTYEVVWHMLRNDADGRQSTACFVSSGLGDALALPRLALWREWTRERDVTTMLQDDFHRHQWLDRTEISVRMSRPDARTVSTTTVEVRPADSIEMRYCADTVRTAARLTLRHTAAVSVPVVEATV